jgi:glycine/D-amino acid oxidase-like deaminating enzyme
MRDELASVRIASPVSDSESDIPCTHVVIAAGAWSPQVFATLFPDAKLKLPVTSLAGHSLVVRSPRWKKEHEELGCHAIYTTDDSGYCPEIFSRVGGEIYIAGMNDASLPLPELATECKIDNSVIEKLQATAKRLLCLPDGANDVEILRKGLCFRPVTDRGTPIISRIVDEKLGDMKTRAGKDGGVFLATGHGPWGISMSLGTGKVMAEIVQGQPTSVHVKALELDP